MQGAVNKNSERLWDKSRMAYALVMLASKKGDYRDSANFLIPSM
ncbi:hypothetical protein PghCCS26_12940 [Paenibacillus glycanilyticus]|uniref:Uncharacterized protein n=1 Tax=Paenibacillus glycanilyticus TaxID=126569 RepID=A0ABQ6NJ05_9BACL|nr:hypothetical protein PghCCS26_12940 [Paenibacillus glycanilyticus]